MDIGNPTNDQFSGAVYFPTIIFNVKCSNFELLNQHLLELVYTEREHDQSGLERSNFRNLGGWHSRNNLHLDIEYAPLINHIQRAGEQISYQLDYHPDMQLEVSSMWSIINKPGSLNNSHIHPLSHWSGVYYVQAPKKSGDIEFIDPRTAHVMNLPRFAPKKEIPKENWTKVYFTPEAGKMLIFPSWLYHSVAPNMSEEEGVTGDRVVISFNLIQKNF